MSALDSLLSADQAKPTPDFSRLMAMILNLPTRWVIVAILVAAGGAWVGWQNISRPVVAEERIPFAVTTEDAPEPSVSATVLVHVAGAVGNPGVVELPGDSRVNDAVTAAGGFIETSDSNRVNLAAPLADGSWIVIPVFGEPPLAEVPTSLAGSGGGSDGGDGGGLIDLNSADAAELESLSGVGPATAEAIISHRESNGPFGSVDELLDVRGIGESKLEAMRDSLLTP